MESTEPALHGTGAIDTSPSPYDVPEALRAYMDASGCGVVELKYIGPDEPHDLVNVDDVMIRTGRNSKRIYALQLKCPPAVQVQKAYALDHLHQAVVRFLEDPQFTAQFNRRDNYKLVNLALAEGGADFLSESD